MESSQSYDELFNSIDDLLAEFVSEGEQCIVCKGYFPGDEIWECPTTANKRCDKDQIDHETNECSPCRLAYEDL